MKAVILAGGLGSRMQRRDDNVVLDKAASAAAESGLKWMMPLNGQPLIYYSFRQLIDAGIRRICVVVKPRSSDVQRTLCEMELSELEELSFSVQPEPLGTANALLAARDFAGDDPFITLNGDTVYPAGCLEKLKSYKGDGWALLGYSVSAMAQKSNIDEGRIRRFAVLDFDSNSNLNDIVEDASNPSDYSHDGELYVSMNNNLLDARIFEACERITPDKRNNEYLLPDAIRFGIRSMGISTQVIPVSGGVVDLTSRSSVSSATHLLQSLSFA